MPSCEHGIDRAHRGARSPGSAEQRGPDAIGVDARISTGYEDHVQATCRLLTDRVHGWWGDEIHGFAYTSRTTPETSTNVAFFAQAPLLGTSTALAECTDVIERLILTGAIQVDFTF